MPRLRFPGWGKMEPIFVKMARDTPNARLQPARGMGTTYRGVLQDRVVVQLDRSCPSVLPWFIERLPKSSPHLTSMARLHVIENVHAFLALTYYAGDVDETCPYPADRYAALLIPMPITSVNRGHFQRWADGISKVHLDSGDGKGYTFPGVLRLTRDQIAAAAEHSDLVDRGEVGHRHARSARDAMVPFDGHPRGPRSPEVGSQLAAEYMQSPHVGFLAATRMLSTAANPAAVLRTLIGIAPPLDLANLAFYATPDRRAGVELLIAASGDPSIALQALMAYETGQDRSPDTAYGVHPPHLAVVLATFGVEDALGAWHEGGLLTTDLVTALRAMVDRTGYHVAMALVHPDLSQRAEALTHDLGLSQLARDTAKGWTDPEPLFAACTPVTGRTGRASAEAALSAFCVGRRVRRPEAADLLLDLGWPLEEVAAAVAGNGRWKLAWEWLTEHASGDRLLDLAAAIGIDDGTVIQLSGPKRVHAVQHLIESHQVSAERVRQLLARLGVSDEQIDSVVPHP